MWLAAVSQVCLSWPHNTCLGNECLEQQAGTFAARDGTRPDSYAAEQSFRFAADGMAGLIHFPARHHSELQ